MKTMERNTTHDLTEKAPVRHDTRRTWWVLAIVALLALGAGLLVGRLTAPASDEPAYLVGGGTLSDRQQQMLDVLDEQVLGWRAGDPDAVAATFAPGGYMTWNATQYRVGDGTLATFVDGGDWSSLKVLEPVLVDGNTLVYRYELGTTHYLGSIQFTGTDEVLALHEAIGL